MPELVQRIAAATRGRVHRDTEGRPDFFETQIAVVVHLHHGSLRFG